MKQNNYALKPLDKGDEDYIYDKIQEYNESVAPPVPGAGNEETVLKIENENGEVIAGCVCQIDEWKIAEIDVMWVDERYCRQGMASALIREAERIFREKGCKLVALGTFDFQARPLYEKNGYTLCGKIDDWPKGHCNYHFFKRLDRPSPEYVPSDPQKVKKHEVKIGNDEDRKTVCHGLGAYNRTQIPHERDYEPIGKKITDENGKIIAAYTGGFDEWSESYFSVWVDEPYRGQGIGSYLLEDAERELKEKGAYVILAWLYEWETPFFAKHGFTVCYTMDDCPEGHKYCCMKKTLS